MPAAISAVGDRTLSYRTAWLPPEPDDDHHGDGQGSGEAGEVVAEPVHEPRSPQKFMTTNAATDTPSMKATSIRSRPSQSMASTYRPSLPSTSMAGTRTQPSQRQRCRCTRESSPGR